MRHHEILKTIENSIIDQKTKSFDDRPEYDRRNMYFPVPIAEDEKDITSPEDMEDETPEQEMMEYKEDFFNMSLGSLKAIMMHSKAILENIENPQVKENLTESWLQGKIAITEDYMRTIHDFVKYVPSDDDKVSAGCGCGGGKKNNAKPNVQKQSQPKKQEPKGKSEHIHKPQ